MNNHEFNAAFNSLNFNASNFLDTLRVACSLFLKCKRITTPVESVAFNYDAHNRIVSEDGKPVDVDNAFPLFVNISSENYEIPSLVGNNRVPCSTVVDVVKWDRVDVCDLVTEVRDYYDLYHDSVPDNFDEFKRDLLAFFDRERNDAFGRFTSFNVPDITAHWHNWIEGTAARVASYIDNRLSVYLFTYENLNNWPDEPDQILVSVCDYSWRAAREIIIRIDKDNNLTILDELSRQILHSQRLTICDDAARIVRGFLPYMDDPDKIVKVTFIREKNDSYLDNKRRAFDSLAH